MISCTSSIFRKVESFITPFFRLVSIIISNGITPSNSFSKKTISLKKPAFLGMSSIKLPEIRI